MTEYGIVIDTNVWVAALRSRRGASHYLFSLLGADHFQVNISVSLILEYEDAAARCLRETSLSKQDVSHILDYVCQVSRHHKIHYLWRPFLKDPGDDLILELAVVAEANFIVTYNLKDFVGVEHFGIQAITPQFFLKMIGAIS
jgi:putative PIN family toxin of toxin-antitoxin system